MNKRKAAFEAWRYGVTDFVYPFAMPPAPSPGRDDPELMGRTLDLLELQSVRAAMRLCENMITWSRTVKAGKLRMLAVQYVIFGEPDVDTIARRMKVSPRRVFQVAREVRGHCMR
jgi:hypothetical protein